MTSQRDQPSRGFMPTIWPRRLAIAEVTREQQLDLPFAVGAGHEVHHVERLVFELPDGRGIAQALEQRREHHRGERFAALRLHRLKRLGVEVGVDEVLRRVVDLI